MASFSLNWGVTDSQILNRFRSVRDASTIYKKRHKGGKLARSNSHNSNFELFLKEMVWQSRDLLEKLDTGRLKESKRFTEEESGKAEFELSIATKTADELGQETNQLQYTRVSRELASAKQELRQLKLDMVSTLEATSSAKIETAISNARLSSNLSCLEALKNAIDKVNEERASIELATLEAERSVGEIEAQRRAEADQFNMRIETAKGRIEELTEEVKLARGLETELAITASDVNVLQNEMDFIRAVEEFGIREDDMAEAELEGAQMELQRIRGQGFQLMAAMDFIRGELAKVAGEKEKVMRLEAEADSNVRSLNSKLLKAKSKLAFTSRAEARAEAIVSNLSTAMQQLQTDVDVANTEKERIAEEANAFRNETAKTKFRARSTEKTLRATSEELEAARASEAIAMRKLATVAESTMQERERAIISKGGSTITISRLEYTYLTGRAKAAQELADWKVAAAQAWIEALEVGEEEMVMETKNAEKRIKELRAGEDNLRREPKVARARRRRSSSLTRAPVGTVRGKMRRSSVSSGRPSLERSPQFAARRYWKVLPGFVRFPRGQKIREKVASSSWKTG